MTPTDDNGNGSPNPVGSTRHAERHAVVQEFFATNRGAWRDRYGKNTFDAHNYRRRADVALSYLDRVPKRSGRLLELGCGAGVQSAAAHQMGWNVTAVDFTVPLLQQAKQEFDGPAWVAAAVEDLPFPDGTFDVVLMLGVIGYVNDPALVLEGVRRVLAPGGHLIISWARQRTLMESVGKVVSAVPDKVYMTLKRAVTRSSEKDTATDTSFYNSYNRFWDRNAFVGLLNEADFSLERAAGVNFGKFRFMDRVVWPERVDIMVSEALERLAGVPAFQQLGHFTRTHVALARRGER